MTDREKQAWRVKYDLASDALARVQARELASMTDAEALRRIEALRAFGPVWRERPDWSGLVEQQAIFHRRHAA